MKDTAILKNKDSQRIHYGYVVMMVICFLLKDINAIFSDFVLFFAALTIYASRLDFISSNKKAYKTQKYIGALLIVYTSINLVISIVELINI